MVERIVPRFATNTIGTEQSGHLFT
jgi:hypothetical protein